MKYKVGDKVRVREWDDMEKEFGLSGGDIPCSVHFVAGMKPLCGKVLEVEEVRSENYKLINGGCWNFSDDMLLPASKLKVVITVDGNATLARLYEGNKVIKSATAKCSPEDKFDFNVGAKIAFDRLTETEEHKYNARVVPIKRISTLTQISDLTIGKIYNIVDGTFILNDGVSYSVKNFNNLKYTGFEFIELKED